MRRLLAALAVLAGLLALPALASPAAHASVTPGNAALDWAEAHALGHWYGWGGTGPGVYDCSGLVQAAYAHAGVNLPRTTFSMLGSRHLVRVPVSQARRGDLLFFGTGHVELATVWYHVSFGAHHSGTRVGWRGWNNWWAPTMAFRVVR